MKRKLSTLELISKEKAKKRREEYNLNPNLCLNCSSPILFNILDKPRKFNDVIKKKFCNRSCAATYNNYNKLSKTIRIRKNILKGICSCGNKKDITSQFCYQCKINNSLQRVLNTPISKYFRSNRNKKGDIRRWANLILQRSGRKKTCEFCNSSEFDEIVQVCHIKEICSFSNDALMGEVNALSNLKYLCPNHHKLLDKKLIDVNGNRIINNTQLSIKPQ